MAGSILAQAAEVWTPADNNIPITVASGYPASVLVVMVLNKKDSGHTSDITDVRWPGSGGTSLTKARDGASGQYTTVDIWYIFNPSAGSGNVWLDHTGANGGGFAAVVLHIDGVDTNKSPVTWTDAHTTYDTAWGWSLSGGPDGGVLVAMHGGKNDSARADAWDECTHLYHGATPSRSDNELDAFYACGWIPTTDTTPEAGLTITAASKGARSAIGFYPKPVGGSQAIWFWFERARRFFDDLRKGLIPLGDLERRYREVMI